MRRRTVLGLCATLASLLPSATPILAQGAFVLSNQRNHPELRWQGLETKHFRIFYHDPLEAWAREAASILERFHAPLCRRLDITSRERTRVYLSDQDQIADGTAVGWDYFFVWIPSGVSSLSFAGGRSWFEEVLIHEYTHILICWASRTWIGTLAFPLGLAPPRWLHEGIAQWTAERWSVFRGDGTLAAAILDGSMDRSPPGVPGAGRLLYARGNARVRWLAAAYGDSAIPLLLRPAAPLGLYSYPSSERRALGKEAAAAADRFRRDMIAFYGERFRRGESPESIGVRIDLGPAYPTHVVTSRDGALWITGQAHRGSPESSLFRRARGQSPRRIVAGGVLGTPVPLADGRVIIPRYHRVRHGSWVADIGLWDPSAGFRFLTSGERAADADTLAGGRIVSIVDSHLGPALAHAPIPAGRGPLPLEILRRWPRGWELHDLASSPDGTRLVVSGVEPDGRRGLWGIEAGRVSADTLRLTHGDSEERGGIWRDREQIAWTSHRSGLSQVRTGSWPAGGRLEADTARTCLGTGAEVAGRMRDSVLVLDRTSRAHARVVRIDPLRHPARSIEGNVYPFPSGPSVAPDTTEPVITGPYPYRALREVRPWLRLPLVGPQAGEPAIGGVGIWAEPLMRHAWGGYLYANGRQRRAPDRGLFYLTTRWGPWVSAFHFSAILPRRVLRGRILYEREEETGVALLAPLHAESDPNVEAWTDAFVKTDSRVPRFGGRGRLTPVDAPRSWSSLRLGGGFGFTRVPPHGVEATGVRDCVGAEARVQGGLAPWPGSIRFLRGFVHAFAARPLALPLPASLWIEGALRGTSGGLPPQEFEGLDADPSYQVITGWPGVTGTVFLRGWPRARAARLVLHGNVEARFRLVPDLGLRGPGVAIGSGTIAPFLEAGHPWGGASAAFFGERTRIACGAEARLGARIGGLRLVPAVAWGRPLGRSGPRRGSWTWRLTTSVPFTTPLRPPMLLRSLMRGALVEDNWSAALP